MRHPRPNFPPSRRGTRSTETRVKGPKAWGVMVANAANACSADAPTDRAKNSRRGGRRAKGFFSARRQWTRRPGLETSQAEGRAPEPLDGMETNQSSTTVHAWAPHAPGRPWASGGGVRWEGGKISPSSGEAGERKGKLERTVPTRALEVRPSTPLGASRSTGGAGAGGVERGEG